MLEEYFDECMEKYFPEYIGKFPRPKIELFSSPNKGGQYEFVSKTISLNRDYINDQRWARSIMFHETIHYIEGYVHPENFNKFRMKYHTMAELHDGFFTEQMNRINKAEGYELVKRNELLNWDNSFDVAKPFYVHCFKRPSGDIWLLMTLKLDDKMKEKLENIRFKTLKDAKYDQ